MRAEVLVYDQKPPPSLDSSSSGCFVHRLGPGGSRRLLPLTQHSTVFYCYTDTAAQQKTFFNLVDGLWRSIVVLLSN